MCFLADGQIILWRLREAGAPAAPEFGETAEDRQFEKEAWTVLRMMSNTNSDRKEIYDLSWSPDSSKLICGSVDQTFTVWDVATGRPILNNKDHKHYVQGVAWDPLDQYIATQSSDKSMHVYQITGQGPNAFELRGVGKNVMLDAQHPRGGTWDHPLPPPPPPRSRSHNSANGFDGVPPSPNGKGRMMDRPGSHHRSLSRDSSHSDVSRASLAETLAGASASIAGGSAIADPDEESTAMDPPTIPIRPSSRRSSTAGSSGFGASPGLTAASLSGLQSSRPMRSPSPAPLPAIMPPSSPKLAPPPAPRDGASSPATEALITSQKLYVDENATPFFRRLAWSPDGSLLLTPAGLFEDPYAGVELRAIQAAKKAEQENGALSNSPMTVKKGRTTNAKKDEQEAAASAAAGPKPTVYVYSRANLARPPVAHLPGHKTTSIAVRFCPVLWNLRRWRGGAEDDVEDESASVVAESDPAAISLSTEGVDVPLAGSAEKDSPATREGEKSLFELPYRMVYAVATLDAVFLYDTQQAGPIAMFANLHYAPFTDISWSTDGQTLIVSSQDGYCSVIAFEPSELGTAYEGPRRVPPPPPVPSVPAPAPAAPIPVQKVPVPDPLAVPKTEAIVNRAHVVPQKRAEGPADGQTKEKKKAKRATLTSLAPPTGAAPQLVQTTLPGAVPPPPPPAGP